MNARNLIARFPRLTDREASVALLIAEGMANNDIASVLGISERTVKNVAGPVALKLDVPPGGSSRVRIALCVHAVGPWAPTP